MANKQFWRLIKFSNKIFRRNRKMGETVSQSEIEMNKMMVWASFINNDSMFSEPYASSCLKPFCEKAKSRDACEAIYDVALSTVDEADQKFRKMEDVIISDYDVFCKLFLALPKTDLGANPFEFIRAELKHEMLRKSAEISVNDDSWKSSKTLRQRIEERPLQKEQENSLLASHPTHVAINVYILACLSMARYIPEADQTKTREEYETEARTRTKQYAKYLYAFGFYESLELVKASGLQSGCRRATLTKRTDLENQNWLFGSWFCFEAFRKIMSDRYGEKVPILFVAMNELFEEKPNYEEKRVIVLGQRYPTKVEEDRKQDLTSISSRKRRRITKSCKDLIDKSFFLGCTLSFDEMRELYADNNKIDERMFDNKDEINGREALISKRPNKTKRKKQ